MIFRQPLPQNISLMDVTKQEVTPQHMHSIVLWSDFICMQQRRCSMGLPLEWIDWSQSYKHLWSCRRVWKSLPCPCPCEIFCQSKLLGQSLCGVSALSVHGAKGWKDISVFIAHLVEHFSEKPLNQGLGFLILVSRDFGQTRKVLPFSVLPQLKNRIQFFPLHYVELGHHFSAALGT